MNIDMAALHAIEADKGISVDVVVDTIKSALLTAYRHTEGHGADARIEIDRKTGVVTHVFTHFPLELVVYTAKVAARTRAPQGMRFVPIATLRDEALPNVMRKAIAHGLGR